MVGIAYKPNVDDIRESPAAEIINQLLQAGAVVAYHDPLIPRFPPMRRHRIDLSSTPLTEQTLRDHDGVLHPTYGAGW